VLPIRETAEFADWFTRLRDERARARIAQRIDRLARGNPGDVEAVGEGVGEMRIHYGPGYRIYFVQRGEVVAVLLCGGDKRTQTKDIATAKRLAKRWKDESQ
jgi:putative addiction module killer protein